MDAVEDTQNNPSAFELLDRHRNGDRLAFAALVERFRAPVHNYLYRCGLDRASREDLLQEIFIKIHGSAERFQPDRPLRAWIFTIAANTARSHFRKLDSRDRLLSTTPANDHGGAADPSSHQVAEGNEAARWMGQAVAELPVVQRQVIVLCCIEQLEHRQVATILDIPINTVKTHLRRARITLARRLARREKSEVVR